uniref:Sulfatase domain-containing protein n=1 Tax=Rhabditophanes sp. KR3021 TaxID=114890 RepID=A0AC35U4Z7_9BILA
MRIVIDDKNNEELSKRHKQNNGTKLNVHIISFDSLSQMSYRRNLPKTVKYFEDTMKGVVLNGYNIVGDGTPQAFLPFLCGKTELEMPDTRKANSNNHYVDEVYPFIWNNYSEKGYVTMYAEDCFDVGTFSYRLNGFKNMPTNHYPRTAYGYVESKFGIAKCIGNEAAHNTWLNYISSYIKAYDKTTPRFALFHHAILSHDDMNLVQVADDDLMNHFKKHFENGDFDNDLVILMADHGNRFAEIRNTHQGQLEERLPFMGIFLPKNFQNTAIGKLYHDNLLKNKDKLSSPFDMHQTLLDILNVPTNKELTTPQLTSKRSLSLFREIPSSRTCFDAGIEKHWCSCMKWENVPNKPFYVQGVKAMANAFINKVNSLTSQERKLCSELKLKKIISSTWLIPKSEMLSYRGAADNDGFVPDLTGEVAIEFADFKIQLQTTPGDAIYDVTINYNFHTNAIVLNMHEVSHINKYGDTPHCIIDKNYFLATYCVCYDTIVNTGN